MKSEKRKRPNGKRNAGIEAGRCIEELLEE